MNITHSEMVKTLCKPGGVILDELTPHDCHLWHMASCIPGEAGELFDAVKKQVIYRKPLNRANVVEELGDLEFYMEGLRVALGITREETLTANIEKLSERYKELQYSNEKAQARADKTGCSLHGTDWSEDCDECEGKALESARGKDDVREVPGTDKTVTSFQKVESSPSRRLPKGYE